MTGDQRYHSEQHPETASARLIADPVQKICRNAHLGSTLVDWFREAAASEADTGSPFVVSLYGTTIGARPGATDDDYRIDIRSAANATVSPDEGRAISIVLQAAIEGVETAIRERKAKADDPDSIEPMEDPRG